MSWCTKDSLWSKELWNHPLLQEEADAILKRWAEHFDSVLNRPSTINTNTINKLPQVEYSVLLDEFPTVTETTKAIQHLSLGKAPGADATPVEIYKPGGQPMAQKLTELVRCMWRKEIIPKEFKDASIIHIHKRKGNTQVCHNHRGVSLLSIAGNLRYGQTPYWIAWMNILIRLEFYQKICVDSGRNEEQSAWSLQLGNSKRNAKNKMWTSTWPLSTLSKHLTVSRDGLWKIMAKFGCPARFMAIVR